MTKSEILRCRTIGMWVIKAKGQELSKARAWGKFD